MHVRIDGGLTERLNWLSRSAMGELICRFQRHQEWGIGGGGNRVVKGCTLGLFSLLASKHRHVVICTCTTCQNQRPPCEEPRLAAKQCHGGAPLHYHRGEMGHVTILGRKSDMVR